MKMKMQISFPSPVKQTCPATKDDLQEIGFLQRGQYTVRRDILFNVSGLQGQYTSRGILF